MQQKQGKAKYSAQPVNQLECGSAIAPLVASRVTYLLTNTADSHRCEKTFFYVFLKKNFNVH